MEAQNVFIGCPTHDNRLDAGTARALWHCASRRHKCTPAALNLSLTAANCNALLALALNTRDRLGFEWMAILHSDIEPAPWWIDTLLEVAQDTGADFVSACVPIKNEQGLVSTALASASRWTPFCRLTTSQVYHPGFPPSFNVHQAAEALEQLPGDLRVEGAPRIGLLCNTGCCLFRLSQLDPEQVHFDDRSRLTRKGGEWLVETQSEDWWFSRMLAQSGGRVIATTRVRLAHKGQACFASHEPWGPGRDEQFLTS